MDIYGQIQKNTRGTWVVISVFVALLLAIGLGFDYFCNGGSTARVPQFTLIALSIGIFSSLGGYLYGDRFVLSSTHARPINPEDPKEKQWQNVIEEMSIAAGIAAPKTYVIDDDDPNAFATGRDPRHSSIAATRGLLEALNRQELQAVAAHEMSHIKNFDIRLMLIVAILVGSIALLADWARRSLFYGLPPRHTDRPIKYSISIIGFQTSNFAQGYFVYGPKTMF
ncbi:MAG: M48 family metalloprotease, partial [Candidatus Omnitrophota bacterium]